MKNRRKQLIICLAAVSVMALSLSGCGKRRSEVIVETETETEVQTEVVTEKPTEKVTESETQKLITSVDYTSKDGTVKITLPDNTWKVTQDADEMRVFSSGSAAMINIVHASTEAAMNNLTVKTTEETLKASLTSQYSDATAYEVESFKTAASNGVNIYRYVVKYNATARMWAYAVTYGIVAEDQAYVITGTVTDENKTLLAAVEESVDSFRILKDASLKNITSDLITGTAQTAPQTTVGATSQAELATLTDYGYDATLYSNDNVNIRLAPGTDSDIIASYYPGDEVTVVGETSGWFKVNFYGNIGYVRKDFLVNTPTTETPETDPNTNNSAGASAAELNNQTTYGSATTLYASSEVNIRTQPSTDSGVIDILPLGNAISVIGETDNWFVVSVNGATGYVSKAYLTYDSSVGSNQNTNTGTDANTGTNTDTNTGTNTGTDTNTGTNTGTDNNTGTSSGGNTGTSSGTQSITGTVTSSGSDYITIQGDDGTSHTVYYGEAANVSTVDGLYDGVYVSVTVDPAYTATDGTLFATGVTGY